MLSLIYKFVIHKILNKIYEATKKKVNKIKKEKKLEYL